MQVIDEFGAFGPELILGQTERGSLQLLRLIELVATLKQIPERVQDTRSEPVIGLRGLLLYRCCIASARRSTGSADASSFRARSSSAYSCSNTATRRSSLPEAFSSAAIAFRYYAAACSGIELCQAGKRTRRDFGVLPGGSLAIKGERFIPFTFRVEHGREVLKIGVDVRIRLSPVNRQRSPQR